MRLSVLLSPLLLPCLGLHAAIAAATPWQSVAPGVELRLISSDAKSPDGTTLVGVQVDMPADYRTYWRDPGESGIPTQFDIAGSSGVAAAAIDWPFPSPEETQGYRDYVYHGPTVLPVRLRTAAAAGLLKASIVMGVCAEVCVPVQAKFELPLSFAAADAEQSVRLNQAEALAPIAWDGAGPAFGAVSYDPATPGLRVALADGDIDPGSVIATAADPELVFGAPQKSPDGRSILLPLRGTPPGAAWTKNPVELTFMTSRGAYAKSTSVAPPAP